MIFRNYQKTFATIGIVAIMIPVFFLAKPQKANALVPVIDAAAIAAIEAAAVETIASDWELLGPSAVPYSAGDNLLQLRLKEVGVGVGPASFGWDSLAYAIAKQVLHALSQSIVQWINSGFEGDPLFITNFEDFMKDQADQATGRFMKEFLSPEVYNAICSPWRSQLHIALLYKSTYGERMRCTLNTVIKNATDFSDSLREDGWKNWMSVSMNPQNDPHLALLMTLDEFSVRIGTAEKNAQTESIFNQGFLTTKKCVEYYDNQWTGEFKCTKYENTSPGKWVGDTLSQATGIDFQQLALADELNEIIAALINQLLTGILRR